MPAARTGHPAAVVTHGIYDGANAGRHFYLPGLTTLVMACFEEFIWIILINSVIITLVAIYSESYQAHHR